jgi:hypothetical protein
MKRLFGAVATAMLLSAGNAHAATVTKISFSVKIDGTTYTCTMDVTRTNDSSGNVPNDILLHAKSDDCQFVGDGTIGKLDLDGSDATRPANIATLTLEPTSIEIPNLIVLLKLTKDIQFQSGNGYYVYGWEDIAAVFNPLGKGKYTVVQ